MVLEIYLTIHAWSTSILIVLFNVELTLFEQFGFLTTVHSFGLFYIIGRLIV